MTVVRELHLRYRPKTFKEVVGQKDAIRTLSSMGKSGSIPHLLLFTGPSGCGKTTLSRIVAGKLKCDSLDFVEINAANNRGIEMVRDIQSRVRAAPMAGPCRVWLIDEAHAMTGDAQSAFLKLLEEPPDHVYFMLATTNPEKLKNTIRTRSTEVKCKSVSVRDLSGLVLGVAEEEGRSVDDTVAAKIASVAEGSPRKAMVLLQAVIGMDDVDRQLDAIEAAESTKHSIDLARALLSDKSTWDVIAGILQEMDDDVETVRWSVMGYCRKILLGSGKKGKARAALIIEEFSDNLYDSKSAGLAVRCWNIFSGE